MMCFIGSKYDTRNSKCSSLLADASGVDWLTEMQENINDEFISCIYMIHPLNKCRFTTCR